MKFVYKGKYKDEAQLPVKDHPAGYVPFKEPESMGKLAAIANGISLIVLLLIGVLCFLRGQAGFDSLDTFMCEFRGFPACYLGLLVALLSMFPHEFLHAICFREEVQMYTNLRKGMLFVVGTEDMSRARFVFMSLLPNLVFGFIPFILYMIFPQYAFFAGLSVFAVAAGAGDYMNVFNCLTQVPKGALVYMSGLHSFWYNKRSQ